MNLRWKHRHHILVASDVDLFGMTDRGYVRTNNEDHFLIARAGRAVETVLTNLTVEETVPGELFEETSYGMVVAPRPFINSGMAVCKTGCPATLVADYVEPKPG
ncbi:MAG TPA: hypothetical protein VFY67_16015 [Pyrinomonadaceae bacterium]|nr:hypothetical protein [Pyrinomonadaceae bacterium]